jgi:hypothetical protein
VPILFLKFLSEILSLSLFLELYKFAQESDGSKAGLLQEAPIGTVSWSAAHVLVPWSLCGSSTHAHLVSPSSSTIQTNSGTHLNASSGTGYYLSPTSPSVTLP